MFRVAFRNFAAVALLLLGINAAGAARTSTWTDSTTSTHGPYGAGYNCTVVVNGGGDYGGGTLTIQTRPLSDGITGTWRVVYTATADSTFSQEVVVGTGQFKVVLTSPTDPNVTIDTWDVACGDIYDPNK